MAAVNVQPSPSHSEIPFSLQTVAVSVPVPPQEAATVSVHLHDAASHCSSATVPVVHALFIVDIQNNVINVYFNIVFISLILYYYFFQHISFFFIYK